MNWLGTLIILLVVGTIYRVLAHYRTAKANEPGCVACGSVRLTARSNGKVLCRACGYEGSADGGGLLTEDEVNAFTNQGDR